MRRRIEQEGSTGLPKDKEAMIMKEIQESDMRKAQQQRLIGSAMNELHIIGENLKKEMENLENLKREEESDEEQEEGEGDPSEEEDEEVELNDEELEFIEALDEFLKFDSVEHEDQEKNENSHLSFFSRIYYNCLFDEEINHPFPFIVCDDDRSPLEVKEEDKHCFIEDEEEKEGPIEEKNKDENFSIEEDQEECALLDTSNNDHENQEASNDTLKSEMSISKPIDSSICTPFNIDDSIDFILPLESFDHKKEVEKSLGILEQKGGGWKKMLRSFTEEKLCIKCMDDRSTVQENLLPFEAQRLRYNGKEDRYPWPFR
ncbi:hypothetical protein ACS0TY_012052 [Phlomoides rotata]